MADDIVSSTQAGVVEIRLDRPQARNALDAAGWRLLADLLHDAAADTDARAVVLTGAPQFFSAGGDVKAMPDGGGRLADPVSGLSAAHEVIRVIRTLRLPVVAAVEGYAIGAAWGVVLACDLVVASNGAFFKAPFAERGLVADAATAWHLARRLGRQRTMQILLTGDTLTASDAWTGGLVTTLVEDGTALETATDLARRLVSGPPEALALTKGLVWRALDLDHDSFLQLEWTTAALAHQGADAREGRLAFAERRSPRFGAR